MGILALLAFFTAFLMHGAGFGPAPWFNWQGLAIIGFILLTAYLVDWDHPFRRK